MRIVGYALGKRGYGNFKALRVRKVPGQRASVVECSSPLELWPKANLANQRVNGFSPGAAIVERLKGRATIRNEETNHGRLSWQVGRCAKGGGPPHSTTLARLLCAVLSRQRPGAPGPRPLWPSADIANQRVVEFSSGGLLAGGERPGQKIFRWRQILW